MARTRSSPDESLLKIFTDAREGKKIRGRIGDAKEPSRPAVLIWPSERDDIPRRDEKRRRASILERFRASDFISGLKPLCRLRH